MKKGTCVTVQRDEKKYPPRGSWKLFRGRNGTITGTAGGEFGVSFSGGDSADAYFKRYELKERK